MTDIKTAAKALVDKLVIAMPKIDDAIVIADMHGCPYDGPQFSHELNNLKTALERDKAIDELVKHDQEIGLYDAPDCDAGKDCPKQWGEPFYGSYEIGEWVRNYLEGYCHCMRFNDKWLSVSGYRAALCNHIYRFEAGNPFYGTDLFANAQKPDANHPCRGGE